MGEGRLIREKADSFQLRQDTESAALRTVPTTVVGGLAQFAMERIQDGFSDSDETAFVEAMLAYFAGRPA